MTLVDGNITSDAQRASAEACLQHLCSPEAQALALSDSCRARDTSLAAPEDAERFPERELVTIADFGGWPVVRPESFGDGGIFDQIHKQWVMGPGSLRSPSALPGFGPSFGIKMTGLSIVVLLPVGALLGRGMMIGPANLWDMVNSRRIWSALTPPFRAALVASRQP